MDTGSLTVPVSEVSPVRSQCRVTQMPEQSMRCLHGRGNLPRWRSDGKELYYVDTGTIFSVSVSSNGDALTFGTPQPLFDSKMSTATHAPSSMPFHNYAVSPDGKTFFIARPALGNRTADEIPLTVVLNWTSLLKK